MITEEMLRAAAAQASEVFVAYLEKGYDPEKQYIFPPEFEKKINRLKRRAKHPIFYKAMHRVASIVIAILIIGGTWIAVDSEARATFVGWVKEIYETYFVYRFDDTPSTSTGTASYRPTWLPEGYTEFYIDETEGTVAVVYADAEGRMLKLCYAYNPNETDWFIKTEQVEIVPASVNTNHAELLISKNPETANAIMWTTEDNTAFYLSAFLNDADLIKVAENIQEIK